MKKILFLHGFFSSGQCIQAETLRKCLRDSIEVISPDLPIHPKEALEFIHTVCDKEMPDIIVGNSCGAFYAQILAPIVGTPALLGNPHFKMTSFLKDRLGNHQYKSPRENGIQDFIIDNDLIAEFEEVETHQFDFTSPFYNEKVRGIFGKKDTLAHYEEVFLKHYNHSYKFPGAHTPTAEEVEKYYLPIILDILDKYPVSKSRYFRHFKGGKYKYIKSAHDSETFERKVVYQALYGDCGYWVRPEKMFFEKISRNGITINRFTEIDINELNNER